eukprot:10850226-Prorocentrum_lima.AAC.1
MSEAAPSVTPPFLPSLAPPPLPSLFPFGHLAVPLAPLCSGGSAPAGDLNLGVASPALDPCAGGIHYAAAQ